MKFFLSSFNTTKIFFLFLLLLCINTKAQEPVEDSTATKKDSATLINNLPDRLKDIIKLNDERLKLPIDVLLKIKNMNPDELVKINERFIFNNKVEDEDGNKYEVTTTVRLGFSQDMITGIIKEVPLYNSASKETNLIPIKIPIKFCCTTPLDSVHKKIHCGNMSELNDFEDNQHCKAWIQKEIEQIDTSTSSTIIHTKKSNKRLLFFKAHKNNEDFGKPIKKEKPSKKNKKMSTDSVSTDTTMSAPLPLKIIDKKKKQKPTQAPTDSLNFRPEPIVQDSSETNEFGKKPDSRKKKRK